MGEIVLEGCHRIAEYLEIGTNILVGEVCGCRGGKVSAGTAAHHAERGISTPVVCPLAHDGDGPLQVFGRHGRVTVGHTILQHGIGHSLVQKLFGKVVTFGTYPHCRVGSAGTRNDGLAVALLRNIDGECRRHHVRDVITMIDFGAREPVTCRRCGVVPQVHRGKRCLGCHAERKQHHCHECEQFRKDCVFFHVI